MAKKFVYRERLGILLDDLSRRSQRSPCQTAKEIEELVMKEREATNFGRLSNGLTFMLLIHL